MYCFICHTAPLQIKQQAPDTALAGASPRAVPRQQQDPAAAVEGGGAGGWAGAAAFGKGPKCVDRSPVT